jgi:hypothetical protein
MRITAIAAFTAIIGSPCFGGIYEDCEEAIKAGNQKLAQELSETIKRFTVIITADQKVSGAACFAFATGEPHVFSTQLGAFVPSDEEGKRILEAQKERAEKQRKQEQLAAERRAAELAQKAKAAENKRIKEERIQSVWAAVGAACFTLYDDDPVEALTNKTCIDVFLETGLPE